MKQNRSDLTKQKCTTNSDNTYWKHKCTIKDRKSNLIEIHKCFIWVSKNRIQTTQPDYRYRSFPYLIFGWLCCIAQNEKICLVVIICCAFSFTIILIFVCNRSSYKNSCKMQCLILTLTSTPNKAP